MDGTMSAADIAAVTRPNMYGYGYGDGMGFGGNSFMWLIALLFLGGGFGGYGRGYGYEGRYATVEDLNNSANFTRLEGQVRANENLIQNGITNLGNGICSLGYQLATDKGEISKQISECCCGTQRAVDSVKFDMANYAAGIQSAIAAEGQKTRDLLQQNKIESLQSQISQLQLQNAMCGVVKFPTQYAVPSCNPFASASYGCGCQNI